MAKIAKLFLSPHERKAVGRQTVIAITQEMTSGRGMSLDINGRQAKKGKNENIQREGIHGYCDGKRSTADS